MLETIATAMKTNAGKIPVHRRHGEVIKKFAVALYILCGSMAYDFIYYNLPQALPSLRTVQSTVQSKYKHIHEGSFRFNDLADYLTAHNLPRLVTISEDATRIMKRIEYNPATNSCVGFTLVTNSKGFFETNMFEASSFERIEAMFKTHTIANYAYMVMAQPLQEGTPSFCISCFGTDNRFTANDVLNRWDYVAHELAKRDIKVVNFAADGDSRLLRATLLTLNIKNDGLEPPISKSTHVFSKQFHPWVLVKGIPTVLCVQDTVHIGVKLKARLLKPSIILPLGNYMASFSHLQMVFELFGKSQQVLDCETLHVLTNRILKLWNRSYEYLIF